MTRLAGYALVLAACATTTETARAPVWTERVELRLDEMFSADSRAIEIRPVRIGINSAALYVRVGGIVQDVEVRTGLAGGRTISPYRIELLSTTIRPSVNLQIMRLR